VGSGLGSGEGCTVGSGLGSGEGCTVGSGFGSGEGCTVGSGFGSGGVGGALGSGEGTTVGDGVGVGKQNGAFSVTRPAPRKLISLPIRAPVSFEAPARKIGRSSATMVPAIETAPEIRTGFPDPITLKMIWLG